MHRSKGILFSFLHEINLLPQNHLHFAGSVKELEKPINLVKLDTAVQYNISWFGQDASNYFIRFWNEIGFDLLLIKFITL